MVITKYIYISKLTDNIVKLEKTDNIHNITDSHSKIKCILPVNNFEKIENSLVMLLKESFIVYYDASTIIIEGLHVSVLPIITSYITNNDTYAVSDSTIMIVFYLLVIILLNYDHESLNDDIQIHYVVKTLHDIEKQIWHLSLSDLDYINEQVKQINLLINDDHIHDKLRIHMYILINALKYRNAHYTCQTERQLVKDYIDDIINELTNKYLNISVKNNLKPFIAKLLKLHNQIGDEEKMKLFKIWLYHTCEKHHDSRVKCSELFEKYRNDICPNTSQRVFGKFMRLCDFVSIANHGVRYYGDLRLL
jgi:hypothetical protein